jgi:hypothetical protein
MPAWGKTSMPMGLLNRLTVEIGGDRLGLGGAFQKINKRAQSLSRFLCESLLDFQHVVGAEI